VDEISCQTGSLAVVSKKIKKLLKGSKMGDNIEVIQEADDVNNKKAVTLAIGGFVGALVGLAAAYLLWQNAEKSGADLTW
jgi:uncharacterized protein involved in exopolysaccharide biosynthesis